jgi:hypothetical protein
MLALKKIVDENLSFVSYFFHKTGSNIQEKEFNIFVNSLMIVKLSPKD